MSQEQRSKWQCLLWSFKLVPLMASEERIIEVAEWLRRSK